MKVAILGANGQLGSDLCTVFAGANHEVVALDHAAIEVADAGSVNDAVERVRADCMVNTTAMHNVEQCEKDPARAFAVNGVGARNLAMASRKVGCYLVHVSTDYVFDGAKRAPYVEDDPPLPLNVYGNTKVAGEYFVRSEAEKYAVVRVSGLYGTSPCRAKGGLNFVRLMLKLAGEREEVRVVDDEILTPTFTEDVAAQVLRLAEARSNGVFHATAQGACSWYEFAARIFEGAKVKTRLVKARSDEFPAKVRRPSYSVLDNAALRACGLDAMPAWQDGLQRYLRMILA